MIHKAKKYLVHKDKNHRLHFQDKKRGPYARSFEEAREQRQYIINVQKSGVSSEI